MFTLIIGNFYNYCVEGIDNMGFTIINLTK